MVCVGEMLLHYLDIISLFVWSPMGDWCRRVRLFAHRPKPTGNRWKRSHFRVHNKVRMLFLPAVYSRAILENSGEWICLFLKTSAPFLQMCLSYGAYRQRRPLVPECSFISSYSGPCKMILLFDNICSCQVNTTSQWHNVGQPIATTRRLQGSINWKRPCSMVAKVNERQRGEEHLRH